MPGFGVNLPYQIAHELAPELAPEDAALVLHTLPLPLPCNNYPMLFAPEQCPGAAAMRKPSYPFHQVPIPNLRESDGLKLRRPVTLGQWVAARGRLRVSLTEDERSARFDFSFTGLIPDSLYTVMSLRQHDLDPARLSRPWATTAPTFQCLSWWASRSPWPATRCWRRRPSSVAGAVSRPPASLSPPEVCRFHRRRAPPITGRAVVPRSVSIRDTS